MHWFQIAVFFIARDWFARKFAQHDADEHRRQFPPPPQLSTMLNGDGEKLIEE